jgi:hypothetical protein
MKILFAQRGVESVGMACSCNVGRLCAFAEHLLNRISGDEVNEQEDEADD